MVTRAAMDGKVSLVMVHLLLKCNFFLHFFCWGFLGNNARKLDGYCMKVKGRRNKAETFMDLFLNLYRNFGIPTTSVKKKVLITENF